MKEREPKNGEIIKLIHYGSSSKKEVSIGILEWVKKNDIGFYIKLSGHPPIFADSIIEWLILEDNSQSVK